MPNDYNLVRKQRPQNKSRVVIETPGVKDETVHRLPGMTVQPTHEATPEEIRKEAIKNRGGAYSDRIKIEPKFGAEPREKPLPSDTDIQKLVTSQQTKI